METEEGISIPQVEEPLSKSFIYCAGNEGDNSLIPLRDTTIQIESTKVTVASDKPPVRDHIVWSILNTVYMNFCCLGLVALIFSIKSRDNKLIGNQKGAKKYGGNARSLNIASSVLTVLWILITLIIIYVNFLRFTAAIKSLFGK
ncbi:hypothetical protein GDO78_003898 [Eleutherodactylus coqui]|uniref:Uncharacterized protein n=1 Tax=Eleutherodactylus coqui TaxID=57060 RepID=A0A8J6K1C7_ELECQ|nr:hypothetical protein GDO78_003898 [Eleutherodactylus coqui]